MINLILPFYKVKLLGQGTRHDFDDQLDILFSNVNEGLHSLEEVAQSIENLSEKLDLVIKNSLTALKVDTATSKNVTNLCSKLIKKDSDKKLSFDNPKALAIIQYVVVILALLQLLHNIRVKDSNKKKEAKKVQDDIEKSRRLQRQLEATRRKLNMDRMEHAKILFEIGSMMENQGNLPLAAEAYKSVISSDINHVGARLGLARIFSRLGKTDQAILMIQYVLKIDPQNKEVNKFLQEFRKIPRRKVIQKIFRKNGKTKNGSKM